MELIKVYSKYIPFAGCKAMTIMPWLFIRKAFKGRLLPRDYRHENIHALQQTEMLVVGLHLALLLFLFQAGWWSLIVLPIFFEIYLLEWFVKIIFCKGDYHRAYRSIGFEQEAYNFESDLYYDKERDHFAWVKYVFKLYKKE